MFYLSETTRVRFRHMIPTEETAVIAICGAYHPPRRVGGVTQCMIETKNDDGEWEIWQYGEAVCAVEDRFVRYVGRKIALTRALELVEPKSLRKEFWEAYFRHVKR